MISIYEKAFYSLSNGLRAWEDLTVYLYLLIFIIVSWYGWFWERRKLKMKGVQSGRLCYFPAMVLLLFMGCRGELVGMDTKQYYDIFHEAGKFNFDFSGMEPGFLMLNSILHKLFSSPELYVFILSFLTIYFVFKSVKSFEPEINLFVSLTLYVAIFYFQAFDLQRIYLASAFMLLAFPHILNRDYRKYVIYVGVSTLCIHYSSAIMLLPPLLLYLYDKKPKFAFVVTIAALLTIIPLSQYFASFIQLARYSQYVSEGVNNSGIGMMAFFDYLPIFMLAYLCKGTKKKRWTCMLYAFASAGFFVRFLGYFIPVIGRLGIHFIALFVIIVPAILKQFEPYSKKQYKIMCWVFFIYGLLRLHFYFMEYLAIDGIMPYYFFWN